jgi:hypothetical protein
MIPETLYDFIVNAYLICFAGSTLFITFAISAFLALAIIDVWNIQDYSKSKKILLSAGLALFPEIGVMSWAVYFGRTHKFFLRIIAFVTSGLPLLIQISYLFLLEDLKDGVLFVFFTHIMWLPFILIGGAISFFILRALLPKNSSSIAAPIVQQEPH